MPSFNVKRFTLILTSLLSACTQTSADIYVQYDQEYKRIYCEALRECRPAEYQNQVRLRRCGAPNGSAMPPMTDTFHQALTEGRVVFSHENAERCLAQTHDRVCDFSFGFINESPQSCLEVFRGTQPEGAACRLDTECTEGRCERTSPNSCGTCVGRAALGEACSVWYDCQSRLTCRSGVCRQRGTAGSRCTSALDCDRLSCDAAICVTLSAQPVGDLGDQCSHDQPCGYNLACMFGGANPGTCQEVGRLEEGDTCVSSYPDVCSVGHYCADGTCRRYRTEAETCGTHDYCADGYDCIAGRCRPPGEIGQLCDYDSNCQSGICVNGLCADAMLCE